jgi:hypothetical protein
MPVVLVGTQVNGKENFMTKSRRFEKMRKAFAQRNVQASALEHSPERISQAAQEQHGGASDVYIGNMVYGGLDGILHSIRYISGVDNLWIITNYMYFRSHIYELQWTAEITFSSYHHPTSAAHSSY